MKFLKKMLCIRETMPTSSVGVAMRDASSGAYPQAHMWTRNMYEEQGYGSSTTPSYPRWSLYALDNQQEESYIFILLLIVELAFNHNRSIVNIIVELWMILHLHGWMSTTFVLLDERWVMHLGEEKHGITNGKRGEGVETPKGHFIHEPRTISI